MVVTITNSLGTMKFDDVVVMSLREELRKKLSTDPSTNEVIFVRGQSSVGVNKSDHNLDPGLPDVRKGSIGIVGNQDTQGRIVGI